MAEWDRETGRARSKAEDLLYLVPDRQHEEDREAHENDEGEEEPQPGARLLALAPDPGIASSAVVVVGAVDRLWIHGGILRSCHLALRGLGHRAILVGPG